MDLFDIYLKNPYDEDAFIPELPEYQAFRKLQKCAPPPMAELYRPSLDESRDFMTKSIEDYLKIENPDFMLLLRPDPGVGKTTAAVKAAISLAQDKRVMYAGPRHNFFNDVLNTSFKHDPASVSLWYEWLPRQLEDTAKEQVETCRYTREITDWMGKGYNAMDFCKGICGWDYINHDCPYHQQKQCQKPLIFTQHAHLTLGHPLEFDVVFGDENPTEAFRYEEFITQKQIVPEAMPPCKLKSMLTTLSYLVTSEKLLFGPDMIAALGGPESVIAACAEFYTPEGAVILTPQVHQIEEAANAPKFYLDKFTSLLSREAQAVKSGENYPKRIFANKNTLRLLLRRDVCDKLPNSMIWLDGTGNARIYEEIFKRKVQVLEAHPKLQGKIYQVPDRAWGKSTLVKPKEDGDFKGRRSYSDIDRYLQQIMTIVNTVIRDYQYQDPVIISYKDLKNEFNSRVFQNIKFGHFGGERGSNEFEECDAVFVIGTPMPNLYDLENMAAQIFFSRDAPFKAEFTQREQAYLYQDQNGEGRCYPISGYWQDEDLQAVLETMREDEIIQAAHRVRPVSRQAAIWLLTNLPIPQLPPDEIITVRELMSAPEGVDQYKWQQLVTMLDLAVNDGEAVTLQDIADIIEVTTQTAAKYMDVLETMPGWQRSVTKGQRRGRPQRGVVKGT